MTNSEGAATAHHDRLDATDHHSIDIESDDGNYTSVFKAVCVCGYASRDFVTRGPASRAGKAHLKSVAPVPMAIWQSTPCPSWCTSRSEGHWDGEPKARRFHYSEWMTVDRPRLSAVFDDRRKWRIRRTGVQLRKAAGPGWIGNPDTFIWLATENSAGEFITTDDHQTSLTILSTFEALEVAELIRRAACIAANEGSP